MPATMIGIAEAVVQSLNAASFSQAFVAERRYLPHFGLAEMAELRVTVVPREILSTGLDRQRDAFDYVVDVAVQRKLEPSQENLDALMILVEEIADHFRSEPLAGFPPARCTEVKNAPVYAVEHLDEFRQFTSLLTLTFRVWR